MINTKIDSIQLIEDRLVSSFENILQQYTEKFPQRHINNTLTMYKEEYLLAFFSNFLVDIPVLFLDETELAHPNIKRHPENVRSGLFARINNTSLCPQEYDFFCGLIDLTYADFVENAKTLFKAKNTAEGMLGNAIWRCLAASNVVIRDLP